MSKGVLLKVFAIDCQRVLWKDSADLLSFHQRCMVMLALHIHQLWDLSFFSAMIDFNYIKKWHLLEVFSLVSLLATKAKLFHRLLFVQFFFLAHCLFMSLYVFQIVSVLFSH